jgi:high-affinity K+ transport system ATPase subunit B
MGPIVKQLAGDYADKSSKFVTFDFTSDETKAAAKKAAAEMGVAGLFAENAPNTGFALIYNTKEQKIVTKLTAGDDDAKWRTAIDGVLGS